MSNLIKEDNSNCEGCKLGLPCQMYIKQNGDTACAHRDKYYPTFDWFKSKVAKDNAKDEKEYDKLFKGELNNKVKKAAKNVGMTYPEYSEKVLKLTMDKFEAYKNELHDYDYGLARRNAEANRKVIDAHKADTIWNAAIDAVLNLKRVDEYAAEDIRRLKR